MNVSLRAGYFQLKKQIKQSRKVKCCNKARNKRLRHAPKHRHWRQTPTSRSAIQQRANHSTMPKLGTHWQTFIAAAILQGFKHDQTDPYL